MLLCVRALWGGLSLRRQSPRGPEHDDVNAHNKMRCVGLVWTTRSMGFEGLETYAANDTIAVAPVVRKKETQETLDLVGKLSNLGYQNIQSENLSYLITNRDENSPAIFYEKMLAKFAASQGVEEDKVADWQKQINNAEKSKKFGFTSFPVLTTGYLS